jgi:hypothetical protein
LLQGAVELRLGEISGGFAQDLVGLPQFRFSRSRALSFSATSPGTPARRPPSTSAFFTQSFRVWAEQPIVDCHWEVAQ